MKLRRFFALAAALCLTLSLGACKPAGPGGEGPGKPEDTAEARFDRYLDTLPAQLMEGDSINLNYTFQDPGAVGIQRELQILPFYTEEEMLAEDEAFRGIIRELDSYPRGELRQDQLETLDIVKDYLERQLLMEEHFYLYDSYLGSYIGFQAQLPMLLNEYQLFQKEDLESYFNLLETAGDTFQLYAQRERERQDRGVGMPQVILDGVIEQCENFVKGGVRFMVDAMAEKIDEAPFLTGEEKEAAKKRSEELHEGPFLDAYRRLGESLGEIRGREDDNGLWSLPGGKEYYQALIQKQNGIDMTVEEVKAYLTESRDAALAELRAEAQADPVAYMRYLEAKGRPELTSYTSAETLLKFLSRRMLEDYPFIGELRFQVNRVPESMEDNFSPAAYLQSRVDTPLDQKEAIYINGEYNPGMFLTVAHEGYPGHMYQNVYFKSLQLPTVRYLVDYGGWTEGWANYVELAAYRYGEADPGVLRLAQGQDRLGQYEMALVDIGIHYDGWTFADTWEHLNRVYGAEFPEEVAYRQYKIFLEDPGNYLRYYLAGSLFQDLYSEASAELGEDFNPVLFHKAILDLGPAPFAMVEKAVDGYVASAKADLPLPAPDAGDGEAA